MLKSWPGRMGIVASVVSSTAWFSDLSVIASEDSNPSHFDHGGTKFLQKLETTPGQSSYDAPRFRVNCKLLINFKGSVIRHNLLEVAIVEYEFTVWSLVQKSFIVDLTILWACLLQELKQSRAYGGIWSASVVEVVETLFERLAVRSSNSMSTCKICLENW